MVQVLKALYSMENLINNFTKQYIGVFNFL